MLSTEAKKVNAFRRKPILILDSYRYFYRYFMQKLLTFPARTIDVDLAHQPTGTELDFIDDFKFDGSGSVFGTFMPHLVILALLLGAWYLYS